tara:strand:+ start:1158 stop:2450 length:1293 start_codon:yes stop_codon:yes gene_type:complete
VALVGFVGFINPQQLVAQLADASATTLGLSGNNTATVRGFGAISVNPAGLAMSGSGFSLALFPTQIRSGLDPIRLTDLRDVQRIMIPEATKEDWLDRVITEGGQTGSLGIDISEVAFTSGNLGFQVSTLVVGAFSVPPGVVEGLLYGNAGRTGGPASLDLANTSLEGFAISTAGLAIGIPIPSSSGDIAVGVTAKYSIGHDVLVGHSMGGSIQDSPIIVDLDFPTVETSNGYIRDLISTGLAWKVPSFNGHGIGIDLGLMVQRDRFSFGASVQNVLNTFSWDESKLRYRPGTASFESGKNDSNFDQMPYSSAPDSLRILISEMAFNPSVRAGVALDLTGELTVSGDLHSQLKGRGIGLSPNFHMGLGAEFRGISILHLRSGVALITDGIQYGGGASLILGPVNISVAGALQRGVLREKALGQFTLSFWNR